MKTLNMNFTKYSLSTVLTIALSSVAVIGCSSDDDDDPADQTGDNGTGNGTGNGTATQEVTRYFAGIEFGTDPTVEVLANADSLETGIISPVNNGIEQPAWMAYLQGEDQIITIGYNTAPEYTSYEIVDGALVKGESFFTTDDAYAATIVDESTMVIISAPRAGLADKIISIVNTDDMEVTASVASDFGNVDVDGDGMGQVDLDGDGQPDSDGDENDLLAFPTDLHVRGDHLFISYNLIHSSGDFSTPDSDEAEVAVFSYPDLEFIKVIKDSRAPNISRYYAYNGLVEDENGDIYTFSPSSIASGYAPVPENNSGILRIKNGETEFDPDFHIDFEAISGGLKINDMFYAGNGKAVVRATFEEETGDYLWANYRPTSDDPLISTGIVDLTEGTYTALTEVPQIGGGWNSPHMIDGSKVYLGVNNSDYSGIYIVDTATGNATEGADIDGNYAKAILSLTTEETVE